MTDLPSRLRARADGSGDLTAGLMRDAADEIERLRREHAGFAELVNEYAQAERPEAMEILAGDRDKWWKAAAAAESEAARMRETLAYLRDWPTVHDNGKPFTRDELVLLLAEMALEATKALKPSPDSTPIVKAGE